MYRIILTVPISTGDVLFQTEEPFDTIEEAIEIVGRIVLVTPKIAEWIEVVS